MLLIGRVSWGLPRPTQTCSQPNTLPFWLTIGAVFLVAGLVVLLIGRRQPVGPDSRLAIDPLRDISGEPFPAGPGSRRHTGDRVRELAHRRPLRSQAIHGAARAGEEVQDQISRDRAVPDGALH